MWTNIRRKLIKTRRVGIGITGLADTQAALGLKYSDMSYISSIMDIKAKTEERTNYALANTRGESMFSKDYRIDNNVSTEKALRNIQTSTIAPVGTGSIVLGVSNAAEPLYSVQGFRNVKVLDDAEYDFIDEVGDKWQTLPTMHPPFVDWLNATGLGNGITNIGEIIKSSSWYKQTAHDILWQDRIAVQKTMQRYINSAISSTINLPNDTTEKTIGKIYKAAHKANLKGLTVYRDGCRMGVVHKHATLPSVNVETARPETLNCDVHSVRINSNLWTIVIGLHKDKVYEIFAFKDVKTHLLVNKGEIVKHVSKDTKTVYDLKTDYVVLEDLASHYMNGEEEVLTRLLSRVFRMGGTVLQAVRDIDKVELPIGVFATAVKRVLSNYIADDTVKGDCLICGGTIRYEGGCSICDTCGDSSCG